MSFFSRRKELLELIKEHRRKNNTVIKTYNLVFSCGGDINEYSNRKNFLEAVRKYRNDIKVLMPEEILSLIPHKEQLGLEKIIAEMSKVILIFLESPGSYTELGTFAFNDNSARKMIVVNDVKYKKENSFINLGPIRKLELLDKRNVFFLEFDNNELKNKNDYKRILDRSIDKERKIIKWYKIEGKIMKVLNLGDFFLYLLDLCAFLYYLELSTIYTDFCILFDVNVIEFEDVEREKIKCTFDEIVLFCLEIAIKWNIAKKTGTKYYINLDQFSDRNINKSEIDFGRVLFDNEFIKSRRFTQMKAKSYLLAIKNGGYLW